MFNNKCPEEIIALASSISVALSKNFDSNEVFLIKQLLSSICSLLSLYETQNLLNKKNRETT